MPSDRLRRTIGPSPRAPLCLGLFLKAPRPGTVKTRLAATLGADRAVAIYRDLVADTVDRALAADGIERRVLFFSPREAADECAELLPSEALDSGRLLLRPQADGDLGERLEKAFDELLEPGPCRAVLTGTDCPDLRAGDFEDAGAALEDHDLVLGPALDGGYWLVGLRRRAPELFRDMAWSTPEVLQETLRRAATLGLGIHQLRSLRDIDHASDWHAWASKAIDATRATPDQDPVQPPDGRLLGRAARWIREERLSDD